MRLFRGSVEAAVTRSQFRTDDAQRRASHIAARRAGSHGALEMPYSREVHWTRDGGVSGGREGVRGRACNIAGNPTPFGAASTSDR